MPAPRQRPNPGSKGGIAASAKLTPVEREMRASAAGNAVLRKYGIGYYSALARSQQKDK